MQDDRRKGIHSEIQRIDSLVGSLETSVKDADPLVQNVFANHLVLAGAGLVEKSVAIILAEFSTNRGCPPLSSYVEHTVSFQNSLNCEKIQRILNGFDSSWWIEVDSRTSPETIAAVDSLKNLRDQIAHGKPNGTGFATVKGYYVQAKSFVRHPNEVINPT